jgi:adenosylmethionine-8-amino-7-oxononanoate aminotransferase
VDSAVRYIIHYFNAIGKPEKKQFIALEWGYHGSSSTGAGLTALGNFHRGFDLPFKWQHHIASPYPYRTPMAMMMPPSSPAPSPHWRPRWPRSARTRWPPSAANPFRAAAG